MDEDFYPLHYTNQNLLSGGYKGYPIGDLNWFPEEKSSWESDANKENYDDILGMIEDGTWDFESVGIFDKFLQGNQKESIIKVFPNPVSGNAQIEYELSKGSNVNLSVYNVLGSEILNITNEFKTTGTHVDIFNTSKFPVGTYIIKLQVNNTISLQKFTVVK